MTRIQIRSATPADAFAVARLTQELGYEASEPQSRERLMQMCADSDYGIFVAEVASSQQRPALSASVNVTVNLIVGWIVVERRLSLESGVKAEITGLVVSNDFRRLGVGEALLTKARGWSLKRGLDVLVVCSNIARDSAHHFYQAQGFSLKKTSQVYQLELHER